MFRLVLAVLLVFLGSFVAQPVTAGCHDNFGNARFGNGGTVIVLQDSGRHHGGGFGRNRGRHGGASVTVRTGRRGTRTTIRN